ncbi:VWA domain-containing protein [Leucobacter sp. BZR 635]
MLQAGGESGVRGALLAAAAVVGVPVELHDGADWWVRDGVAHVGLQLVADRGLSDDEATAQVLLLLWESVREVRVAPARRRRRIALSAYSPRLEPLLALLDRLLAASELLAAMPSLRRPIARAVAAGGGTADSGGVPGELPRHLQWVSVLLDTVAVRWVTGQDAVPAYLDSLAPEVRAELAALDGAGGETAGALALAISADPRRSPMQRFERAFGLLAPGYERLFALDAAGRGPQSSRNASPDEGAADDAGDSEAGFDSAGGSADEDATDGGEGGDATTDGDTEAARAGDKREGSEGADLFAAEQAGFVATVLSTPLPATGAWAEGLDLPDMLASDAPDDTDDRPRDPGTLGSGGAGATALASYRERAREHSKSIDEVREVWRQIVSDRVREERAFTRLPQAEGDLLDRDSLVRVVADVAAGMERPRAFLARQRRPRPSRREGSTDYVLLIDRSASMQGPPAEAAATAALIMLEALAGVERDIAFEERALGIDLELSLRTALIVFDSAPHVVKPLAGALDDLARRTLDGAIHSPQGSTNDAAALAAAAREFGLAGGGASSGVPRRRVAILVSDGGTNDADAAAIELSRLRNAGVTVIGIGIRTDDIAKRFAPDGIRLDAHQELPTVLERLVTNAGITN